jgi:hypothetical protein
MKELLSATAIVAGCVVIALQGGWFAGTAACVCAVAGLVGYLGQGYRSGLVAILVGWLICLGGSFGYFRSERWVPSAAFEFTLNSAPLLMVISTCPILIAWAVGRVARFAIQFDQQMKASTDDD